MIARVVHVASFVLVWPMLGLVVDVQSNKSEIPLCPDDALPNLDDILLSDDQNILLKVHNHQVHNMQDVKGNNAYKTMLEDELVSRTLDVFLTSKKMQTAMAEAYWAVSEADVTYWGIANANAKYKADLNAGKSSSTQQERDELSRLGKPWEIKELPLRDDSQDKSDAGQLAFRTLSNWARRQLESISDLGVDLGDKGPGASEDLGYILILAFITPQFGIRDIICSDHWKMAEATRPGGWEGMSADLIHAYNNDVKSGGLWGQKKGRSTSPDTDLEFNHRVDALLKDINDETPELNMASQFGVTADPRCLRPKKGQDLTRHVAKFSASLTKSARAMYSDDSFRDVMWHLLSAIEVLNNRKGLKFNSPRQESLAADVAKVFTFCDVPWVGGISGTILENMWFLLVAIKKKHNENFDYSGFAFGLVAAIELVGGHSVSELIAPAQVAFREMNIDTYDSAKSFMRITPSMVPVPDKKEFATPAEWQGKEHDFCPHPYDDFLRSYMKELNSYRN